MKVIRRGIFETNSSSTHAISIPKNEKYTLPKRMTFKDDGEFGWEYDILEKKKCRWNYLYTALKSLNKQDYIDKLYNYLTEDGIKVHFNNNGDGYIDHENKLDDFIEALMNNKDLLYRYLFCENSFIMTGNDNDDFDVDKEIRKESNSRNIESDIFCKWN